MTIPKNTVKRMILLLTLVKLREHMKNSPYAPIYLCHIVRDILIDLALWKPIPNDILIKPSETVFPSIYKHKLFVKDGDFEEMWGWWARNEETSNIYNAKRIECKKLIKKIHKQKEKYLLILLDHYKLHDVIK